MPLSDTDRRQPEARASYLTKMSPASPLGNACFSALITSSVTINPRLTASLEVAAPPVACTLSRERTPLADHRFRQTVAKLREIGSDLDAFVQSRGVQLLLHRCHRHDALVRVLKVHASLFGLHGASLEQENAGDNLKTVGNAVLHFLQQNFFLLSSSSFSRSVPGARVTSSMARRRPRPNRLRQNLSRIEQHHAPANGWEFMLNFIGLDRPPFRDDVFEDGPEPWNIPLPVAQLDRSSGLGYSAAPANVR